MSQATLLADAATIKNETIASANTATRVGTMLEDIINEAVPYKVYKALLTQTGTGVPTVKVLENTFGGTLVWSYTGVGDYLVTLAGAFPDGDKVFARISTSYGTQIGSQGSFYYNDTNSLGLASQKNGSISGAENGCFTDSPVEITVYP